MLLVWCARARGVFLCLDVSPIDDRLGEWPSGDPEMGSLPPSPQSALAPLASPRIEAQNSVSVTVSVEESC